MANEMEKYCGWAFDVLRETGSVDRDSFLKQFGGTGERSTTANLAPIWNRAVHAIYAVLKKQEWHVTLHGTTLTLDDRESVKDRESPLARYTTTRFQATSELIAKQRIGELIASFLHEPTLSNMTVFLGSGSTVFHVGLKMCEGERRYSQRFVTVNIPLVSVWCTQPNPPVNKISIPEAVLETQTFRFSTMPALRWPLTISVLGADGCFYDEGKVVLYGNEESVAANTSLFVQNTRHTVLLCLTSSKIKLGFAMNTITGPPISSPKRDVIRVVVTDERYENSVQAFQKDGWMIVTESEDWEAVRRKMKEGETTPARIDH
jgi:DeoR/GlpR family transcriptional regulator of sugar metabolism